MHITLRFFAVAKTLVGVDQLDLIMIDGDTVASVFALLREKYPAAAELFPCCAAAVNLNYVPRNTSLKDGDELAIIPPVSGG